MIGSRPTKVAWPALLGLLALLVFCSSASAREVYVANSGNGTVSMINTTTNAVTGAVTVGGEPVDVAITPDGRYAWVVDGIGGSVSVIDTKTKTVVQGPIAVGLAPRGIAITPNGGRAYVTNSGDDTVTVLNTGTYAHGRGPDRGRQRTRRRRGSPPNLVATRIRRPAAGGGIVGDQRQLPPRSVDTIDDSLIGPSADHDRPAGLGPSSPTYALGTLFPRSARGAGRSFGPPDPRGRGPNRRGSATTSERVPSSSYRVERRRRLPDPDRHRDRTADRSAPRLPRRDWGRDHPGRVPGVRDRRRRLGGLRPRHQPQRPLRGGPRRRKTGGGRRRPGPGPDRLVLGLADQRRAQKRLTFHASGSTDYRREDHQLLLGLRRSRHGRGAPADPRPQLSAAQGHLFRHR